ncbi:MAG: VanZ family protein [Chloroflexi bacterium]|nr:VanZ family protein [Chloroflexota bacterium]
MRKVVGAADTAPVWVRAAAVVAWAAVIFVFSSFSNPPGQTGREWTSNAAHMTEYAVLAALAAWAALAVWPRARLGVVLLACWAGAAAYGASDEYHQSFVPGRDSNVTDFGFDALGAGLSLAFVGAAARARAAHRRRREA